MAVATCNDRPRACPHTSPLLRQDPGQIEFSSAARLTVGSTSGCGRDLFAEASAKTEASLTVPSWNQLVGWLRELDSARRPEVLRHAAPGHQCRPHQGSVSWRR